MRGLKQKMLLKISKNLIEESLIILKNSPRKERVLLWLGRRLDLDYIVDEVYVPIQIVGKDYFRIPEEGMEILLNKLRLSRKMIIAQIHTHPFEAFHSAADNEWAIVRHVGAYSLVLPFFCRTTNINNFSSKVAIFVMTESNNWGEADNDNLVVL